MTDDVRRREGGAPTTTGDVPAPDERYDELESPDPNGPTVRARSQWQLFRRKFVRHKLAMSSLFVLGVIVFCAVNADWVAPYGFNEINVVNRGRGPQLADSHFFGTDRLGRDYFSRVLFGTRTSLQVAIIVSLFATLIGSVIGALAGYYRGWVDAVLMRFTDLVLTLPGLAVLLVASALLGQGDPIKIAFILAGLYWVSLARIVRGTFLSLREKEYVEAARASGSGDFRIMFRHMLPNALGPIIVNATLVIATAILVEAALSFLGFGVQPPRPALGALINDGRSAMVSQWWLVTLPGLTLVAICLCVNFIGDGLRDALDPTQRESA